MDLLATALAAFCGVILTIQVAANERLGMAIASSLGATLISFLIGTAAILACLAVARPLPQLAGAARAPWWSWTGGLMGAAYVGLSILLLGRLSACALMATVIAGQLAAAVALDHFGWLGVPLHHLSGLRLSGCALMVIGVVLVLRS
jgi:transporter family-2 protein